MAISHNGRDFPPEPGSLLCLVGDGGTWPHHQKHAQSVVQNGNCTNRKMKLCVICGCTSGRMARGRRCLKKSTVAAFAPVLVGLPRVNPPALSE